MYIPTPEVNQLTQDQKLQEECLKYVGKKGKWRYVSVAPVDKIVLTRLALRGPLEGSFYMCQWAGTAETILKW